MFVCSPRPAIQFVLQQKVQRRCKREIKRGKRANPQLPRGERIQNGYNHCSNTCLKSNFQRNLAFHSWCEFSAWPFYQKLFHTYGFIFSIEVVSSQDSYGSVSAGRGKWPFRVLFFLKVERSCG